MLHLGQIYTVCPWSFLTLWQSKPKVTLNEVSSKMTPLTSSICTRALVLLCQSWPPPRAPLSGGRSWKPSPVSGLHCWTMGKDKRLKTPSSKGTGQDYCRRCWLFYLLSSHWVCMCVCVDTCVYAVSQFDLLRKTQKEIQRERGEDKRWRASNDEVTWREVRSFQMGLYTHIHSHQPHCPRPYSTYTIQSRILLHHALFSLCGLKPAELTKAKAQGLLVSASTENSLTVSDAA